MNARRRLLLASLLAAALLSACQLRSVTTIGPSGAGEFRTEIGFTPDERQRLEEQGANPEDFCAVGRTPAGMVVLEEQRGEDTWCINIHSFSNMDQLRALYSEEEGITVNRLEIVEDRLYYDIALDTASPDSSLSGFSSITWTLAVPGTLLEQNAATHSSASATWEVAPGTDSARLVAESTLEPVAPVSRLLLPMGVLSALGIGLVVAAILFARRTRRTPA